MKHRESLAVSEAGAAPNDWKTLLKADVEKSGLLGLECHVVCVVTVKNEMDLAPDFLDHHRKIGIQHFVVVDDHSDDGTYEFFKTQKDVTLLRLSVPYREFKSQFRALICDTALVGKWVTFVDADERLIFRNCEEVPLPEYLEQIEKDGFDALVGLMVDTYPREPSEALSETPCDRWFDGDTYWAIRAPLASRKKWPTPEFDYFGGAQERLFFKSPFKNGNLFDKVLARISLNLVGSTRPPKWFSTLNLQYLITRRLRKFVFQTEIKPPKQNKIPILLWKKGTLFSGGVHRVNLSYRLARDRVCLLHLKLGEEFWEKVDELAERGQHAKNAETYKYLSQFGPSQDSYDSRHSRKFSSSRDLEVCRLFG